MSTGDAYLFAVVLQDYNVEEYKELYKMISDFNDMLNEEMELKRKDQPTSMRNWYFFDMFLHENGEPREIELQLEKLEHDNMALALVSDDSCHTSFNAISKIEMCTVADFMDNYKSWVPNYFSRFRKHTMVILPSHYDCKEEFLEGFKVKEWKEFDRRNYRVQERMQCCNNCNHSYDDGITDFLECEHPIELTKSIETRERKSVHPFGICDEYKPGYSKHCKPPVITYIANYYEDGIEKTAEIDATDEYEAAIEATVTTLCRPTKITKKESE